MQILPRSEIPTDYRYYRSGFVSYRDYTSHIFPGLKRIDVGDGFFGWVSRFFFGFFSIAKFLKTQKVPDFNELKQLGMRHGIVYWSPWGNGSTPGKGWKKLTGKKAKGFHHADRSCFSILDTEEYWKKWSSNARNHLKQIKKNQENGTIKIQEVLEDEWLEVYRKTDLPHRLKGNHTSTIKRLADIHREKLRIVLAYLEGVPMAGAVFLEEQPTSVYLVAFQDHAAKPFHLGLAIIDWWFADSFKKGFKYLDFDHMWSPGDPESYKGYTQFKSELADYEVEFPEVWYRWF